MNPALTFTSLVWNLSSGSMSDEFEFCAQIAKNHYENFTVGSWFLPKHLRRYFFALYAFCRYTDDLGDEAAGDRLALLDDWEKELDIVYGFGRHGPKTPDSPIMLALQKTVKQFDIPDEPFRRLIEANRMDQRQNYFKSYSDLLWYCEHSANPVGRMVLYLLGYRDPHRQMLSDYTCTALQLTNFWQDVRRDKEAGRIYIPFEDMIHFGYTESDLKSDVVDNRFRALIKFEVDRTEDLFRQGLPLIKSLGGKARIDVALFSKGGQAVLGAIRSQNYDVLSKRPSLSSKLKLWLMLSTATKLKLSGKL